MLRELNRRGRFRFRSDASRAEEVYRILKIMPQTITRRELIARMPEYDHELAKLFTSHPEPTGGYRLRGMALYGLSENERAFEYMARAGAGDFSGMQELMRIAHNGDRVAQHTFDAQGNAAEQPYDVPTTDADLDEWIGNPRENPIWSKHGFFERSIEKVDCLCDLIDARFADAAAARISAAGLGGAVMVVAKSAHAEEIREFLSGRGFRSTPPLLPSAGASILECEE